MSGLKKAIAGSFLAISLVVPSGSIALADTTPSPCPDQAVFSVVLPPLLGQQGGSATITTNEHPTLTPGQCAGTFVITGAISAQGALVANHSGSNVTAYFVGATATGAFFFGSLAFNGTTGVGSATAFVYAGGVCNKITATFARNSSGQFVPVSVTPGTCGDRH